METTRTATLLRIAREALAKRDDTADEGADSGFTLIELMVVLLILAILLAIAIPTFLGVTNSAHDRAAQSNLTNALTAAKASYVNNQAYATNATSEAALLNANEPSLAFTTAASTGQNSISVGVYPDTPSGATNDVVILATYSSATKTCWWAADVETSTAATINSKAVGFGGHGGVAYTSTPSTNGASCVASAAGNITAAISNQSY